MQQVTWLFCSVNPEEEQALFDWTIKQCARRGYQLKVATVLPKLSKQIFNWFADENHQDLQHQQIALEVDKRLTWQQQADALQVNYQFEVHFGKLFYEMVHLAQQYAVGLLIKQAEDIHQAEEVFFQSEDWHLLRKCAVPLLLYRQGRALPFTQVMVSMDVNIDDDPYQPTELNQSLLNWAEFLQTDTAVPQIIHAWQADVENLIRHWHADIDENTLTSLNESLYLQHKKALNVELEAASLSNKNPKVFMCKGEPAAAIASMVEEKNTDLLVMGSLARGGIPGLLIGNTAEDLLERVNCSVLTVKPKDFKSPIV